MDKWSKIRAKLVDAQEELYKVEDEYRKSKNDLDTKWNFLGDFYRGLEQKFDEKHSIILSEYSKMPDATEEMLDAAVETIRRYRMVNEEEFKTRQRELERKYDDLEDSYKKKSRKQDAVIEQLSSELRSCQMDEKQEEEGWGYLKMSVLEFITLLQTQWTTSVMEFLVSMILLGSIFQA